MNHVCVYININGLTKSISDIHKVCSLHFNMGSLQSLDRTGGLVEIVRKLVTRHEVRLCGSTGELLQFFHRNRGTVHVYMGVFTGLDPNKTV